jgi:hypothetical protein
MMMFFTWDVPEIYQKIGKWLKDNKISESQILDMVAFTQLWSSTSLGFGGIGGSAMTTGLTTIYIIPSTKTTDGWVFFNSGFAYKAEIDDTFLKDMEKRYMPSREIAKTKYKGYSEKMEMNNND